MSKKAMIATTLAGLLSTAAMANTTYIAKGNKVDASHMTAQTTTMTTADGQKEQGMLFTAYSTNGERLDFHSKNFEFKINPTYAKFNKVFVPGMTDKDIQGAHFDTHKRQAGSDAETDTVISDESLEKE